MAEIIVLAAVRWERVIVFLMIFFFTKVNGFFPGGEVFGGGKVVMTGGFAGGEVVWGMLVLVVDFIGLVVGKVGIFSPGVGRHHLIVVNFNIICG